MSDKNTTTENNLIYFLRLILSNWKVLAGLYMFIGTITIIVLLLLPKWYKSEATIVMLEDNTSSLSNLASQFSALGIGLSGGSNVETYIEYLNTQKLYDRLIREFNLEKVYKTDVKEELYDNIFNNMSVADNENRTFTISYAYKEDPEKAAEIVHFLYEQLNKIALEVDKAEASNFRRYVEKYYQDFRQELKADEDSLTRFQQRTGLLDLETQLQATIEGLAELEKEKISLEIEKNYLQNSFQNPPRINEIQNRIQSISQTIDDLTENQNNTYLALNDVPKTGANYLRLRRDIMVGEKVSEFLRLQYEQALLDEQKIDSNLYMVDPPQVPDKRFKPQRTRTLFIVMFFTVLLSLIGIRLKEAYLDNIETIKKALQ